MSRKQVDGVTILWIVKIRVEIEASNSMRLPRERVQSEEKQEPRTKHGGNLYLRGKWRNSSYKKMKDRPTRYLGGKSISKRRPQPVVSNTAEWSVNQGQKRSAYWIQQSGALWSAWQHFHGRGGHWWLLAREWGVNRRRGHGNRSVNDSFRKSDFDRRRDTG